MKINKELISSWFLEQLERDGFAVQAILADLEPKDSFSEALGKIQRQTNDQYPKSIIQRALSGREEAKKISQPVQEVISWFRSKRRRKFVLELDDAQQSEKLLAADLEEFSQGKPTDFIVWNCIRFDWDQNPTGGYPPCRLNDNLDVSIVGYFLPRLQEAAEKLSSIGNPVIIPMVPSTEATYESMWTYKQSREEREDIVESTVSGLKKTGIASIPGQCDRRTNALG